MEGGLHLCGPEIELLERREFDELLRTGTGDVGERQAQVLQVSKGARTQQASQIGILQEGGEGVNEGTKQIC